MQKAHYFKNKGQFLAGTLHLPAGRKPCPGVVILHGFTGWKCEPHFIFVELSRRLADAGIASLRFDFRGSGESEGLFEDMTPLEELSDARAALAELRGQRRIDSRRLGVVGLSLGGMIAALLAGKERSIKSVVLWSAPARPDKLFKAARPKKDLKRIREEGRLDIGGLYLGNAFLETLPGIDPPAELAKSRAPALVIHGSGDEGVPYSHSGDFLRAGKARGIRTERLRIEGSDHVYSSIPWRNEVIEATVSFLKETLM